MPALRFCNALLLPLLGLAAGWGCGPSVQSIYEGNVRFEHCYRLDIDVNIAPTHRLACWQEWLRVYTYGQVRDRIEYARQRLSALQQGDTSRPSLNLMAGRRPEERGFYLSEPAPTSAHAPPPPMWKAESPPAPPTLRRCRSRQNRRRPRVRSADRTAAVTSKPARASATPTPARAPRPRNASTVSRTTRNA